MASDKPSGTVPPPRQRPAPTIDLKATEIASEPVKTSQAPDSTENNPKDESSSGAGASSPPPPGPGSGAGRQSNASAGSDALRLTWMTGGAALAGAVATILLVLALWGFGAFGTRDDGGAVLAARLATLETQVRELANRPLPAGLDQRVFADLAARLGAAEQNVARLAAVEAGLSKLETAVAAPKPPVADPALVARVAALESTVRSLSELGARIDALDAAQKKAASVKSADPAELAALAQRVNALEQAEKAIEQRAARPVQGGGADQAGRAAFVAVALRAAAERGEPFAQELAAAKTLAPDAAMLAPLEPYAASGIPRAATLARELSQLAGPILNAAGAAPREGGILDRLQQNAERLVRIRPVNETPGDDPAAIVARSDVKAAQGDLAGALAELARLPEAARAPAQAWMRKAQMQVAALGAARKFAESAVGALSRAGP
jgi:hypothetical protein